MPPLLSISNDLAELSRMLHHGHDTCDNSELDHDRIFILRRRSARDIVGGGCNCELWRYKIEIQILHRAIEADARRECEDQTEDSNKSAEETAQHEHNPTPRKPFELREPLWNEPPDLDYSRYECFDAVQKEFKDMGGKVLEWKTKWLDLNAEIHCLWHYEGWASTQMVRNSRRNKEKEKEFYDDLRMSLRTENGEVYGDLHENDRTWEKDYRDRYELSHFVETIREREKEKKKYT